MFRKPTHTDLYLQWDSQHTISSKYSVAGTLYHRAKTVCSDPQLQKKEEGHLCQASRNASTQSGPSIEQELKAKIPQEEQTITAIIKMARRKTINRRIYMVVPYQQGLSERFKNTCQKYGVQVHFKGGQTIKDLLMAPKDKDPITNKSGVIYRFKCSEDGCEEEYIGESARTFAERFKEHQKSPSPIHDHCNISGHKADINNFSIIGREDQNLTRAIKEALFIRVNDPSLNRNIGKYHLPHI